MKDSEIIELYFQRDERAISETQASYGKYCYSIAYHILHTNEDSDECVNDTYLRAWNSIPPNRPNHLSLFLGAITRNLSIDMWKRKNASKRGNGEMSVALDELAECMPDARIMEDSVETKELSRLINDFLHTLKEKDCNVFLRRYWYSEEYREIADRYQMNMNSVKTSLFRTRQRLKEFLEQEGVVI